MPKAFKTGLKTAVVCEAFYNSTCSLRTIYCDIFMIGYWLARGLQCGKTRKEWKFGCMKNGMCDLPLLLNK